MKLKDEHKIIFLFLIGAALVWIIDAWIDSSGASPGSLWDSLLFNDSHEFYMRFMLSLIFVLFGVATSRIWSGRKQLENSLIENEKRYRMLFESAGDAIFIMEAEGENAGKIVSVNRAAAEMHAYSVEELLNKNIADLDEPDAVQNIGPRIERMLRGEWIKAEIKHRKKDGTVFPVEISAGLLEIGGHKYILAFDRDITERQAVEKALRESEAKYRSVMESVGDSIYLVDKDCNYLFMNKKHLERLHLSEDGYRGKAYADFHSAEESRELSESVNTVFGTGKTLHREHLSKRDNKYFLRTLSPVRDADGNISAVTVLSKDVNDLKQMEEKLRGLSLTDELTNLYNRRGFFRMVEQVLKTAKRENRPVSLLYADLDNLKTINDTLGHHEGDRALVDIANLLRATYRDTDVIARIGGDEFVVIPIGGKESDTDIIIDRFRSKVKNHNERIDRSYTLSVSLGVSHYDPASPSSIDELVQRAEKLMYDEKAVKKKLNPK